MKIDKHHSKPQNSEGFDKNKRSAIKHGGMVNSHLLHDKSIIPDLESTIEESLENIDDRNLAVKGLFETVKRMMTTESKSVKC